ncbi:MAG: response regulator transcription factor [Flavobacteriales bacterium]|nr:response regulator transcription factor [Flavobacteriales bacterium]
MNTKKKILLVDDESDILDFLSYNLSQSGYEVRTAMNGEEGVEVARVFSPDLILLDMMMPDMDGVETCEKIRSITELENVMVAFLTARGEDYSQIAGFDDGADDYILKPIKPKVLMSRVNALMKRTNRTLESTSNNLEYIEVGEINIDLKKHIVSFKQAEINLPKKEFQLLTLLCSQPGVVQTRGEIMDKIWGTEVVVGDRTIDVHIRKLREKFGEDLIVTIKGIGYKLKTS